MEVSRKGQILLLSILNRINAKANETVFITYDEATRLKLNSYFNLHKDQGKAVGKIPFLTHDTQIPICTLYVYKVTKQFFKEVLPSWQH